MPLEVCLVSDFLYFEFYLGTFFFPYLVFWFWALVLSWAWSTEDSEER